MMAACGGKATETATETAVEATPATEAVEETPAAPAEEVATPAAPAQETKKADPCEAKVKAFEKFVDELAEAQKNKGTGRKGLLAFEELLKQAPAQKTAVNECKDNAEFKTRIQNALMRCGQIQTQK
jgi:hypothetical protein